MEYPANMMLVYGYTPIIINKTKILNYIQTLLSLFYLAVDSNTIDDSFLTVMGVSSSSNHVPVRC